MQFTVNLARTDLANFVKVVFSSGLQISTYPAASLKNTLSVNECLPLCSHFKLWFNHRKISITDYMIYTKCFKKNPILWAYSHWIIYIQNYNICLWCLHARLCTLTFTSVKHRIKPWLFQSFPISLQTREKLLIFPKKIFCTNLLKSHSEDTITQGTLSSLSAL